MRSYADGVVTYRVLLDGYERAVERVQAIAVTKGADPGAVYVPLFEALNWAVALDDRTRILWAPTGKALGLHWRDELPDHGPYISAVRYVRNCVHHDWSEAIAVDRGGRRYPRSFPTTYFEWLWRPPEDFQSTAQLNPINKKGEPKPVWGIDDYRALLVGAPVRQALTELVEAYRWIIMRVEPDRWGQAVE